MCAKKAAASQASDKSSSPKTTSTKKTIPLNKSASAAAGKAAVSTKMAKSAAAVAAEKSERTLSEIQIGEVAGEIWGLLSSGEAQTLAALKKSVNASPDLTAAAIGWLAREDKLEFVTNGRTLKISLKQ
jgi:hypothetical protein